MILIVAALINLTSISEANDLIYGQYVAQMLRLNVTADEIRNPQLYKLWKTIQAIEYFLSLRKAMETRSLDFRIEQTVRLYLKMEASFFHEGKANLLSKLHELLSEDASNELLVQINIADHQPRLVVDNSCEFLFDEVRWF